MSAVVDARAQPRLVATGPAVGRLAPAPRVEAARVHLLEAEPGLAAGLTEDDRALAHRHLVVPGVRLTTGPWTPDEDLGNALGMLVVSGIVLRDSGTRGLSDVQLFGPGDLFDPRLLADGSQWLVLDAAHIAVLDARVVMVARRWPQMIPRITQRLFDGHHEHHLLATLRLSSRVEERVFGLLMHLASRWGHVTPSGVTLALPVTHELLGRLVGARRPTVSLALTELRQQGRLSRLPDGRWLLPTPDDAETATAAASGRALVPA